LVETISRKNKNLKIVSAKDDFGRFNFFLTIYMSVKKKKKWTLKIVFGRVETISRKNNYLKIVSAKDDFGRFNFF
jgi:hypothetical protein